jgi:hypothetical protein
MMLLRDWWWIRLRTGLEMKMVPRATLKMERFPRRVRLPPDPDVGLLIRMMLVLQGGGMKALTELSDLQLPGWPVLYTGA